MSNGIIRLVMNENDFWEMWYYDGSDWNLGTYHTTLLYGSFGGMWFHSDTADFDIIEDSDDKVVINASFSRAGFNVTLEAGAPYWKQQNDTGWDAAVGIETYYRPNSTLDWVVYMENYSMIEQPAATNLCTDNHGQGRTIFYNEELSLAFFSTSGS